MIPPLRELLAYVLALDTLAAESVLALRHPVVTNVMTSVTGLGSVAAGLVLVGLFYLAGWHEEFLVTLIALSITGAAVAVLMSTVQRPFPAQPVCLTDGAGAPTTSFPSGHAAAVTAYAMVARSSDVLPFKTTAALAAVVAASRIYLGTHYLSDTVAGIALGVGAVLLAEWILDRADRDAPFRAPRR
jgi:membrane-associated phospholipid phosphatase